MMTSKKSFGKSIAKYRYADLQENIVLFSDLFRLSQIFSMSGMIIRLFETLFDVEKTDSNE